ncbi:SAM-dependent methyltransferase [Kocuria rosea]|uniref:class I SAM-dependent DNA methyltransferase n=1 Tax=Kocuria rosea TaxID=1275 RepID=UPI000D645AEB|nr:class I SAM-dependent methyltransferase [Kocuria rosea]MEB2528529.1 class I SAM-dependent methyltransferase [Kocuria rosea]MEB2619379.1 class I SAM-dependent methyltransferase [Kocuria rosea]PWF82107.1 SAM-dependent methyltransferase [Kocuria rosea]QCY31754.1 class I SAM-dependent methyltransferase [Kocuria rosea]TQN39177.1 methyltransferase family protein [Kocuria rosea]
MGTQPGYDALAEQYELTFPNPFQTPLERHAVAAFADKVLEHHSEGTVMDIGCGTGHVTAELAHRGLHVMGIDPSDAMLDIARRSHPEVAFRRGGANLNDSLGPTDQLAPLRGVLARFSLIHIDPHRIGGVLDSWAQRMPAGGVVLLVFQSIDGERQPAVPFDHAVAPAWRWHPEEISARLARAGFDEVWRTMSRPDPLHRFPECHLAAIRRP